MQSAARKVFLKPGVSPLHPYIVRRLFGLLLLTACSTPTVGADAGLGEGADRTVLDTSIPSGDASAPLPDGGQVQPDGGIDPSCVGCRADGEECIFSINCQAGSICNDPLDPHFDPSSPAGVCVRVICLDDRGCQAPKRCGLDGVCREPPCQSDTDCADPALCIAGRCDGAPRPAIASCRVVLPRPVLGVGATEHAAIVAFDAAGAVVAKKPGELRSSTPTVAEAGPLSAVIGRAPGPAQIGATIDGVPCAAAPLLIVASGPSVVVFEAESGAPIVQARVDADGALSVTDQRGIAVIPAAPRWVTVSAAGRESLSIEAPPELSLIPLVRARSPDLTAGSRGVLRPTTRSLGDAQLAVVGHALSLDATRTRRVLRGWACPIERVVFNAPELGFDNMEILYPEGEIFGLGSRVLSNGGGRCVGAPGLGEACYHARAEAPGLGALWALGGNLRLSEISSVASELFTPTSCTGTGEFGAAFNLLARQDHGTVALVEASGGARNPLVGSASCVDPTAPSFEAACAPRYTAFAPADLRLEVEQRIQSDVEVLGFPASPCAGEVLVMAAVELVGRGAVPLGMRAARLRDQGGVCVTEEVPQPFGGTSAPSPSGHVPLTAAPPHGGLEDGRLMLLAQAISAAALPFDGAGSDSLVFEHLGSIAPQLRPFRSPISLGPVLIDRTGAVVRGATLPGAQVRVSIHTPSGSWTVWARSSDEITLPMVRERALLSGATFAEVSVLEAGVRFESLFDAESAWLSRGFFTLDRGAVWTSECRASGACSFSN